MVTLIEKSCGNLTLSVAPELGGAIAALNWRDCAILRPLQINGELRANLCGSYPLIPWSNRISQSQFSFAGQTWQVAKNFGDHPHAIHGNGWQAAWKVTSESSNSILLEMTHDASEAWPWPYHAIQLMELSEHALRVSMTYINQAETSVPVGLGFHPFFAHASECEICFVAKKCGLTMPVPCQAKSLKFLKNGTITPSVNRNLARLITALQVGTAALKSVGLAVILPQPSLPTP